MKTIDELAQEAGMHAEGTLPMATPVVSGWWANRDSLRRFAALVRAQAMEDAAKQCWQICRDASYDDNVDYSLAANDCAESIRQKLIPLVEF